MDAIGTEETVNDEAEEEVWVLDENQQWRMLDSEGRYI